MQDWLCRCVLSDEAECGLVFQWCESCVKLV